MYAKHCKLSINKQLELMKYFVAGSTTGTVADLAEIHGNTAIRFFHKLRCVIAHKQQRRAAQFTGEIELDDILVVFARGNVVVVRRERWSREFGPCCSRFKVYPVFTSGCNFLNG